MPNDIIAACRYTMWCSAESGFMQLRKHLSSGCHFVCFIICQWILALNNIFQMDHVVATYDWEVKYMFSHSTWPTFIWDGDMETQLMMTSSNGNIFRVTGLLCGEFTGHRWIRRQIIWNRPLKLRNISVNSLNYSLCNIWGNAFSA